MSGYPDTYPVLKFTDTLLEYLSTIVEIIESIFENSKPKIIATPICYVLLVFAAADLASCFAKLCDVENIRFIMMLQLLSVTMSQLLYVIV